MLQEQLPGGLRARLQERVFVETPIHRLREIAPDVRIVEHPRLPGIRKSSSPTAGGAAIAEPFRVAVTSDPVVEGTLEIVDTRAGSKLVTAIELLSLANKRRGAGMDKYRQKQEEVVAADANLVEIDLLRGGDWVLLCPRENVPAEHRTAYQVSLYRASQPLGYDIYRVPLRERLPIIRIPLRADEEDATLDLQAIIDKCYRNAGYDFIDYTKDPVPPLDEADAAWADGILKQQGKR
jgi:hypothetical protein